MEIIFYSHANKTPFHKKGCELGLILKVNVLGTQKWPIEETEKMLQNAEANAESLVGSDLVTFNKR